MKKPGLHLLILITIFISGLFIRSYNLEDNIIFAYDQARDAQRVFDILSAHDLKIVGPETDIPGVFNSPLLYYLLGIIFFLFNYNLNIAALFFILINLLMVFALYYISVILFKEKNIGLIAAFLWILSYEFFSFSRYISNASLMIIGSIILFLGLAILIFKKKNYGLTISVLGLALAVHSNIYLIYLIILYPVYYFIYHFKLSIKTIFLNFILLCGLLGTFVIAELKFKFIGITSLLHYGSGQKLVDVFERFSKYFQKLSEFLYLSFFSFNNFLALLIFIIFLVLVYKVEKRRLQLIFLFVWIFSTLPLYAFSSGVLNVHVVNTTIFGAVTILFALSIYYFLKNKKYFTIGIVLIMLIIIGNYRLLAADNFKGVEMFGGKPFLLSEEKKVIDYTYKAAKNKKYSVCAVTTPLFVNSLWSYLYFWYGKEKYGYMPYWTGQKQVQNKSLIPYADKKYDTRFLIIQSDAPDYAIKATILMEDQISTIEESRKIGETIVQKRKRNKNSKFIDSQGLDQNEINHIQSVIKNNPRFYCDNIES